VTKIGQDEVKAARATGRTDRADSARRRPAAACRGATERRSSGDPTVAGGYPSFGLLPPVEDVLCASEGLARAASDEP